MQEVAMDFEFDLRLVLAFALAELVVGLVVGVATKAIAKLVARSRPETYRVFEPGEYEPKVNANFLKEAFSALSLATLFSAEYEFVIVEYRDGDVASEEFYTVLGDRSKARYRDSKFQSLGGAFLASPVYTFTVVLPAAIGFLLAIFVPALIDNFSIPLSLPIGNFTGVYLLSSGIIWFVGVFWPLITISLFAKAKKQ